jgi:hypothetical protein
VEATFGTGKRIYRANNIRAKRADTGASWVGACYFVKNINHRNNPGKHMDY